MQAPAARKAMTGKQQAKEKGPKCHYCGRFGHIRRNYKEWARKKCDSSHKKTKTVKLKANRAEVKRRDSNSSDSDSIGLMVNHMMSANSTGLLND